MIKKIVLSLFVASVLFGDKASDFKVINADVAYKQNITGAEMNIGVIDQAANSEHIFFIGDDGKSKIKDQLFTTYEGVTLSLKDIDFSTDIHGTFVTSVLIGNKNTPAQGIAYDANTYNAQLILGTKTPELYDYFVNNKVVAINNSWDNDFYPFASLALGWIYDESYGLEGASPSQWIEDMKFVNPGVADDLMRLSKDNKAVVVFSSGNNGVNSPGVMSTLRSFDESLKTWIVVGAIDSNPLYTTTKDGKVTKLSNYSLANFSDGFKGAQSYAILAPGVDITGANASYPKYSDESSFIASGTSFAAPHVTAAATLVAQKFPFLQANQIADVVLSTANDSFKRPSVITKDTIVEAEEGLFLFQTVFYIDKDIPKKDGKIDKEQVINDLIENGYSSEEAIYATDDTASIAFSNYYFRMTDYSGYYYIENSAYPHIQKVSFADVFGQGILDIGKAMGGLGKLDANRMSTSDISGDQAIYKINTQGYDAVFSNDISQVLWKDEWHLEDAINSQKALKDIEKIGLEKQGDGALTLSGKNTYLGDTILSGGEIILTGSLSGSVRTASNTKFTMGTKTSTSSPFVGGNFINDGTLAGIGKIDGDLTNNGLIMAGFYDYTSAIKQNSVLEVGGTFTQTNPDAKLQLAFTNTNGTFNTGFKAAQYNLSQDTKLEYIPIQIAQDLIAPNQIINLSLDSGLVKELDKFSTSVVDVAGTNLLDFYINDDKTKIAAVVKGGENPFEKKSEPVDPVDPTDPVNPTPPDPVEPVEPQPVDPVEPQPADPTDPVNPTPPDPANPVNPSEPIKPEPTPSIYENTIIGALQSVLSNKAASFATKSALAQLDNLVPSAFNEALESIKDTPNNANINTIETLQKGLNIKNTLFLLDNFSGMNTLNTSSVVFEPTAAFGDEYLGKVDDIYIKTQASAGIAYRRTNHDDYKQDMYMLDIQGKKQISENSLLGGFIGFANAKTTKDYSEVRSNMFSLGLSYNHDFGSFGLLGLASVGMSFNNYDQSIKYISGSDTDARYKNYFASFQIGAYKSFNINENSIFTPLAMIDYSVIKQDSFDQNGALAKHYDSSTTNYSRAWLGANLNHKLELKNSWSLNASLFAFYWHKLGNSDINQDLSFIESASGKFASKTSGEKQGFYGGIALEAKKNNKFFRVSFSDEKTSAYNQYEIMLRAGVGF